MTLKTVSLTTKVSDSRRWKSDESDRTCGVSGSSTWGLLAAVVFSSYHLYQGVLGVIDTFLFGVMYGAAYLALRRIWPLVLGHMLYNVWGTLLG